MVMTAGRTSMEARDLYRFFHAGDDETFALRGISLDIEAGEMIALVGPSGSGKSTLLNCLAGLDEPDGGSVSVGGQRLTRRTEAERARLRASGIGILAQSANLLDHLSVAQNVGFARRIAGRSADGSASDLLARLGLEDREDAWPSTLSGGEAARAGLAVALANDPFVVLADEPTGELDRALEELVLELLASRAREGGAVCVVTHSELVAAAADRVVRIEDGKIVDG
jgi:putative ABC transport system ATP-binding protein